MSTLFESYNAGDDSVSTFFDENYMGQTFTPSVSHYITSVKLKLYKVGSFGNIWAYIFNTTAGLPSGSSSCYGILASSGVTTDTAGAWYTIALDDGSSKLLSAGTKYAIVCIIEGDVSNYLAWRRDGSSPSYSGGAQVYSGDYGSSWTENTARDMMFEEWGDETAEPDPPVLNSPSDGASVTDLTPLLQWNASVGADSYGLQLSTDPAFGSTILNLTGLTDLSYNAQTYPLKYNTTYYWRVNATNEIGTSAWTSAWNFLWLAQSGMPVFFRSN